MRGVGEGAGPLLLVVLLELRREIDRVADHREFEPLAVAHGAEHDAARRDGQSDLERRQAGGPALGDPAVGRGDHRIGGAQRVRGGRRRRRHRAERGQDAVAQELVDAAAIAAISGQTRPW